MKTPLSPQRALLLICMMAFGLNGWAQLSLTNASPTSTIDFTSATQSSVGTTPTSAFTGAGFSSSPTTAGRLNSNAWAVTGWSDGALAFGASVTTGDYARGATATAVTTGGFYAFTGSPQSAANPCLMIQPGGSDFAPGTITLKITNNGTTNITQLSVGYNLYVRNDQGRSSSFNFSHSADNSTYTAVGGLDYTSATTADALGWVIVGTAPSRSTTITGITVTPGSSYFVRWSSNDVGGSGSRDEIGLDDISVTGTFAPSAITSAANGAYTSGATWVGGVAPTAADNVIIAHNVTAGALTRNSGTSTSVTSAGTLAVSGTYTGNGSTTVTGTFRLDAGGWATGTTFTYGAAGTLNFNNTSSYGVNNADVFWPTSSGPFNVNVLQGGVTLNSGAPRTVNGTFTTASGVSRGGTDALTLNGTVQINAGGFFNFAPTYGSSSTLIYNTGGGYGTGNEWTGGASNAVAAGSGVPANVSITNSTNVTLAGGRGTPGNVTVNAGATLTLNTTSSNDLYVGGNFTQNGSLINNGRAVLFVLGNAQTISSTNGGVFFDFLLIDKSTGSVQLSNSTPTNVTINTTSFAGLHFLNVVGLDLNGRSLIMNNSGGGILLYGGNRSITSSIAGGSLIMNSDKTVSGPGTLVTDANVSWFLNNGGMDFGSSQTTINGTLQINSGGYVNTNPPTYGGASTLIYNSGGAYGAGTEWRTNAASGVGVPQNVQIGNGVVNSSLNFGSSNQYRQANGNVTITNNTGANFTLSSAVGGDLRVVGNFVNNGTFTPNSRQVTFNGTSGQTITGTTTFDYLRINNSSSAVTLNNPITINNQLDLSSGRLTLGSNNATLAAGASTINSSTASFVQINGTGTLVRNSVGASAALFPVGTGSNRYTPITLNNSGTVNNISVSIGTSITNGVADASRVVTVEWVVSPAGAGTNVVATIDWVTTTNQNASFNNTGTGELGVYTTGPNYAITNLGTLSGTSITTPAISLAAGVNKLVVGNTNAIVAPLLFAGSSSLSFSSVAGLASTSQNFTISGVNLLPTSGSITVTGTTNYEVSNDNVTFGPSATYAYTGGTFASTPTYVRLKASVIGTYNNETVTIAGGSAITLSVTCSGSVSASQASDIVTVAGSEAVTVSSLLNSNISTVADGTQVWQFDIRDGGGSNDADNLPSIVTAMTFAQSGGNEVNNWLDAIQSIQLFDGTTLVPATINITNTQVQFTGLNISVADNTTKRISVRLTLQTAFDNVAPGANQDGEDFGFSLSNANATFAATGSGKTAFAAATSTNGLNVIEVIATQLSFSAQPSNVGVGATMSPAVAVTGADINGNPDKNGAYVVSITSGGTLTGTPVTVTTVNGTATFSGLVHSVTATNVSLTAAAAGVTSAVSNGFDIVPVTTLAPGDAMIVGLDNLETGCSGASVDIVHVLFLKDILVGTNIDFTDNAYTTASGPFASNEGVFRFTKTGSMLPAGTVVSFSFDGASSSASGFSFTSLVVNLSIAANDQVFLLFGGNTVSSVYTGGTIVSGITSNGWLTTGSTTSNTSYLPAAISCASTAVTTTGQNFYKYNGSVSAAPIFEWTTRISNTSNWIRPSSCANFSATTTGSYIVGSTYSVTSPTVTATDFCTGNTSTAVISGYTTITTFTWTAPAGITATGTGATATLTSNAAGTYVVSVTPTNGACSGPQNTVTVTVSPNPTPTASNNGPMCEGGSLSVSVTSASSYAWSGPSSFSASTVNPLVSSNASSANSGTYIVTVTGVNGCTATASTDAIVNANPTPTISGPTATCAGTTVTYDAGVYSGYVWNVGNATQTNDYSTAGTYSVTVTDANSCTGAASKTLAFNANPTVTLSGTNPACGTVTLTANGANSYVWSTGGNTDTENFTTGGTTSFTVTGTDSNGCSATFSGAATVNNSSYNVALATSGDNGQVLLQSCEEGPWTYYADPDNGKYYFAIKWDPSNIGSGHNMVQKGNAQVKTFVNASLYGVTAAATTGTTAQPPKGTWVMSRGWNVTNAGTLDGNVDVRFFYDAAELSAIQTAASNFVTANPTSNLEPLTWFKTVGTDYDPTEVANGNRISAEGVYRGASLILTPVFGSINGIDYAEFNTASFSGGGVASGAGANGNPLPIKLEYFRGEKNGENANLTWRTQTEENNSHFIVERSLDGRDFRSVGQVQGAGNSASPINYAFTDENPVPGNNYYRLRQVDFNGASEFSNVVVLNFEKPFAVNAYPNPFNSTFTVDVYTAEVAEGKLEVFDISGRLLDVRNLNLGVGMNRKEVDASLWTPGAYLLKVTAGSNVTQRTMVKTQF